MTDEMVGAETPFNEGCYQMRDKLKVIARQVAGLRAHGVFGRPPEPVQDRGEMIANIMLAYRHLEDATMRLGKAVQAFDGGKSVYDK